MYSFTEITDPRGLAQIAETLSQDAAIGRLGQACDRWIYTACLVFGLDLEEQERSGFRYAYSVYQAEYSRNLIFASGARMDRVFGTVADRTRSRLDVPSLRTLFGVKQRPAGTAEPSLKLAVVIERPAYDLTLFKVHFGLLTAAIPKANACCASRRSCTTPGPSGPAVRWTSSPRSSPG